ncbi:MAG TPA: hypothetical protein QF804_05790 [Rhodospirillales bacterium]|nr:hypothetical protein [Rhodospirillales bacterium]
MNITVHLEKAARYEALVPALDRDEDYELWHWCMVSAAVNALNAALHAAGVTDGRDCYPVRSGKYLEPGAEPHSWVLVEKPLGDILHVGFPPIEAALTPEMERAVAALQALGENLDAGVRGALEVTPEMKDAYFAAYGECLKRCRAIVVARAQGEGP